MSSNKQEDLPYFLPQEVVIHNKPNDCWVIIHGKIYNVTQIVQRHRFEKVVRPLLVFAGKDISQWFTKDGDLQTCIHPKTGVRVPYLTHGYIPGTGHGMVTPCSLWTPEIMVPWWKSDEYLIGRLTKRARQIKICNKLTQHVIVLNVCAEDTFKKIAERLKPFNSSPNYVWWRLDGKIIEMRKTMEENGLIDDRDTLERLGMPSSECIPLIMMDFTDDPDAFVDSDETDEGEEEEEKQTENKRPLNRFNEKKKVKIT